MIVLVVHDWIDAGRVCILFAIFAAGVPERFFSDSLEALSSIGALATVVEALLALHLSENVDVVLLFMKIAVSIKLERRVATFSSANAITGDSL